LLTRRVVCTVVAPTFFSAANYIILGIPLTTVQVDKRYRVSDAKTWFWGSESLLTLSGPYSILTPRSFAIIFMTADFVCLVVQGAGGGIAGTADTTAGANNGAYIMTGGVVLQRESIQVARSIQEP
jgi:hypothetical protein